MGGEDPVQEIRKALMSAEAIFEGESSRILARVNPKNLHPDVLKELSDAVDLVQGSLKLARISVMRFKAVAYRKGVG